MAIREFLASREADCKRLVDLLGKEFEYVSVLGSDVTTKGVVVNRHTSRLETDADADKGFTVKMTDGRAFFEYSLDDVSGDIDALAKKILSECKVADSLEAKMIESCPIADEPLEKSFERENDFDKYSDAELLKACTDIKDAVIAKSENVANATTVLRTLDVNKIFVSKNRLLEQAYTWVNGFILVNYREGDKAVSAREGSCYHLLSSVLSELPTKVDALVNKAKKLINAKPIEPAVYDVITDPSVTGLLAHEAFGHGVEMDMFVKDRALAKNYIGKYVASPICNMRDGAGATLSVASYFFDDDGVLAHDTQIIKDGILVSGISDLISASELGTEPTGNGRRQDHTRKAYSRMTNTFFERGTDKLEDMIASIEHGYMIFETNNGMEDPKNWAIQCVAEYGIEIVDGKLTDNYVSPVVMSGYVPDVLKSISMISDAFVVEGAGMCGKGHKEWVRVSDGGPALKLRVKLG
ncbi:MAG: TldD/PmbA family protein [Bacteroides sp.]|nr:TldD/PmbA family protein [Bacillota bacterium]MCM1394456.1 TldD/PmbA family protein [[Eubacterium] siraeum]MCM1456032.1 TldD/PmbA family protein [Bacteroides sp.]